MRPTEEVAKDIQDFLDLDASFNVYMFHGGINFGFTNGANYSSKYAPTVTSYDYNAPLSEAGDRTELYYTLRSLIQEKYGNVPILTATETQEAAYGKVALTKKRTYSKTLTKFPGLFPYIFRNTWKRSVKTMLHTVPNSPQRSENDQR